MSQLHHLHSNPPPRELVLDAMLVPFLLRLPTRELVAVYTSPDPWSRWQAGCGRSGPPPAFPGGLPTPCLLAHCQDVIQSAVRRPLTDGHPDTVEAAFGCALALYLVARLYQSVSPEVLKENITKAVGACCIFAAACCR